MTKFGLRKKNSYAEDSNQRPSLSVNITDRTGSIGISCCSKMTETMRRWREIFIQSTLLHVINFHIQQVKPFPNKPWFLCVF